ncbi:MULTISPECIES: hypothetical protein [unclassified Streptomyces]|uniref:hypothetical protein n=1 Tax=unclassified Streptomyces TaxID=2593676 RepID=UPI002DD7C45B|nr:hypothetical protein [Streptomyces sp. NBC_01795]WSA97783.1 hypothetical protein OIE63_40565 [Streptomyces sp. NBC_01795]WSS46700.1 hypothetical protein OG220_39655 [Streptomyces sp. NBC_01187]WSS47083.1 hypothetical protein OG220_41970 [Streptomyces sp. NBC_01187]
MDEADAPHADERPLRAAMKRAGWAMLHITREVGPGEYQLTYTGPGLGDRALTLRVQAKTSTLPEGVAVETRDPAGVDLLEALLALALHAGVKDLATLTAHSGAETDRAVRAWRISGGWLLPVDEETTRRAHGGEGPADPFVTFPPPAELPKPQDGTGTE